MLPKKADGGSHEANDQNNRRETGNVIKNLGDHTLITFLRKFNQQASSW
jgi:hypothetical protein